MSELINLKIKVAISIVSLVVSWFIAQASIIEQGFDQLFSLGLLVVAVLVIWKAFTKKDESETKLLKEQIQLYREVGAEKDRIISEQRETIENIRNDKRYRPIKDKTAK